MIVAGPYTFRAKGAAGLGDVYSYYPGGLMSLASMWEAGGGAPGEVFVWGMNPCRRMRPLAELLLAISGVPREAVARQWLSFAVQVLLHLPPDEWHMTAEEVVGWAMYHPLDRRIGEWAERGDHGLSIRPTPN